VKMRSKIAWMVVGLSGLCVTGCDSGPCPSGSVLVENACIAVEGERCAEPTALYRDVDGDGFGNPAELSAGCKRAGFSEIAEDCDDADPDIHPDAPEQCNGLDDDCDGVIDDDPELITWHLDFDEDGFGDSDLEAESCVRPEGYVSNAADCDDENAEVRPTALELCNRTDDNCSGAPDDGAQMECALGELVECTTECGSVGTTECTPECRVSLECAPPLEVCNGVDDYCDGVVDEGLLTARVASEFDMHDRGLSNTSARLVSAKNGLFLFYFGRLSVGSGLSYNVRLYVVKLSDEGEVLGEPVLLRESPAGEKTGPIEVVTVGYSAYVALPPTDAGAELLRVSLVDLFEINSVVESDHDRWRWQGQCLASDGETVAWGTVRWDVLQGQPPGRNDFEVSFYDNALVRQAKQPVSFSRAQTEGLTCGLLDPRTPDNKWLAAHYADEYLHLQALTATAGVVDGFSVAYASSERTPLLAWDAGGHATIAMGDWVRRYAVGDRFVHEDSVNGFAGLASGDMLIDGGRLFTTTTDGVDIREVGDLNAFLQYPTPGPVDTIVAHAGRIFMADAPPDGAVTLRELGCF